ncbi:hypothetical protein [Rhizobium sp. YTU87027]|uniref:hypothetical protein n=1 Tax=Rhizobium sp. YTU87027 TaxID=3417741 RepID=UPI003D6878D8
MDQSTDLPDANAIITRNQISARANTPCLPKRKGLMSTPFVRANSSGTSSAAISNLRDNCIKVLMIALCAASVLGNAANSKQAECSKYWLKIWEARTDPEKWSYTDLSYYAQYGAHPTIPGYSSTEIAAYFAALAIKNNQGLDIPNFTTSSENMRKLNRSIALQEALARFYGIRIPGPFDRNRSKCLFTEASTTCLPGLARRLLPEAGKMQQYLDTAVRTSRLGGVPCEGAIEHFNSPNYR